MQKRRPHWLKKQVPYSKEINEVKGLLTGLNLNTVCQSAKCPNIGECFARRTATFMILGNTCTRNCRFCAVPTGVPSKVDELEPANIATAVTKLGLKHLVLTSVTRDDLPDGGAGQFMAVIQAIRQADPQVTIEILTPDFLGDEQILNEIGQAQWHVYNHNVETIPRLYSRVRPEANYERSLHVLTKIKSIRPEGFTKSGLMLGLGEQKEEVVDLMADLRKIDCDFLTIGQYLQPTLNHLEVVEYLEPDCFDEYRRIGLEMGFRGVAAGPFVRSSYKAAQLLDDLGL